ncbi:MAG: hypothetical protein L3J12_01365, partial [Spirochaetales bacterium]|nr:hypothetical protein [Spirochaetales bacterium]
SLPSKFGGRRVTFPNFTLFNDSSYITGETIDIPEEAIYINIGGWVVEGRMVSVNGSFLEIGRAVIDLPSRMEGGRLEFTDLVIDRTGNLVDSGLYTGTGESFTSVNGFDVVIDSAELIDSGLFLSGDVYLPSGLGADNFITYVSRQIRLGSDGFITTPPVEGTSKNYQLAGFTITGEDYSFRRDGLHFYYNILYVNGVSIVLEDVLYYPDGTIQIGGNTLQDPNPISFLGWVLDLKNIRLTDLGLAVDAGITLPPVLDNRVVNFNELTLYQDGAGDLKVRSDVIVPRLDFPLFNEQLYMDFRYISLIDGDFEIKETIITLPDFLENRRVRIGVTSYDPVNGFDLGGISMDPIPLWGYTLFLDNLDIDNDQISFEGRVKLPDDFYFPQMAGEVLNIVRFIYHFDTQTVEFDVQYDGQTFDIVPGWSVTALDSSLRNYGFSIGTGILHFPQDWTSHLTVDEVGFTGLDIQFSPANIAFDSISASGIGVTLDTYQFTINSITYDNTDGFILAGTFPMEGVFQGDAPVLELERLQITPDFILGDLVASLVGADLQFTDELLYKGNIGVSYLNQILTMNAVGQFVFDDTFVLEDLRGTAVDINAFEFNLNDKTLTRIDADWSSETVDIFGLTANQPSLSIDYNTPGVSDGISFDGNLVFPPDFPGLGNEELILGMKAQMSGMLTAVTLGVYIEGPKDFIGDTQIANFQATASLNETVNGLLFDISGDILLGQSFPQGLAGATAEITTLVIDTNGGLKELDASLYMSGLRLMDSFDIENAFISLTKSQDTDLLIGVGGTLVLPSTFPEGLAGQRVVINDFSFTPSGTIHNVDIGLAGINTDIWGFLAMEDGSFTVTNNGNDELLFGFDGDLILPQSLGTALGGVRVNIAEFIVSTKTGLVSFNAGNAAPIDFEIFAGIDASITNINLTETGFSMAGNITFPDYYPEGIAGLSIGLDEFGMTWNGDITALSAGIAEANVKFAGFTAEIRNLALSTSGVSLESLTLLMPENMNGTTIEVENAGYDTDGHFYGDINIPFISIDIAGYTVVLDDPDLDFNAQEISFSQASLIAPELVGGWTMALSGVTISPDGIQFTGGQFSITDFTIADGLGFTDVYIEFTIDGPVYVIGGGGAVTVPGLGTMAAEISFTNMSPTYPIGLRYAYFSYTAYPPGMALGTSGLFLSGIRGGIAFGPADEVPEVVRGMFDDGMRLSLGLTISDASGGYVIKGDVDVWVDVWDWDWAFEGDVSVIRGMAHGHAIAALTGKGFYAELDVNLAFVNGEIKLYVFPYNNKTQVSGSGNVKFGLRKGSIASFKIAWKRFYIPKRNYWLISGGAEFGLFSNGQKGVKGYVRVPIFGNIGAFAPSSGGLRLGNLSRYTLYNPFAGRAVSTNMNEYTGEPIGIISNGVYYAPELTDGSRELIFNVQGSGSDEVNRAIVNDGTGLDEAAAMERLVFAVAYTEGDPQITVVSPTGISYTPADAGVELHYTEWGSAIIVFNPEPGEWSIQIDNMPNPDSYLIEVFGTQVLPELSVASPSYTGVQAEESFLVNGNIITPDGEPGLIEIYLSKENENFRGEKIGEVISDLDGSYEYLIDTSGLAEGEYYIYASYTYLETPAVRVYAPGSLRKDIEKALEPVTDLIAAGTPDGNLSVSFNNPNGDRSAGYRLYVETMVNGVPETKTTQMGNITTIELPGYEAETTAVVYVKPYNSRREEGPESSRINVSFETPVSQVPVNDFTMDLVLSVNGIVGESTEGELIITAVDPVITNSASDYIRIEPTGLPEGIQLLFSEKLFDISSGSIAVPFTIFCEENIGVGDYSLTAGAVNISDPRTAKEIEITVSAAIPSVVINELTETEINNLDTVELIVFGDYFFEGTKLYMDDVELTIDARTRYSLTTTILPGTIPGAKTIKASGADGSQATISIEVVKPDYLVEVYGIEISLTEGDFYSFPFDIIGLNRFAGIAEFTLTGVPAGWDSYLTNSILAEGDTAFIQGTIPAGAIAGVYNIQLSADSGAVVDYSVTVGETIYRLGLVFRNADGSKEGKSDSNGDIFINEPTDPVSLQLTSENPLLVDT